ncbi:MAG: hypothetical protein M3N51_07235 [Actinomycetota bacterium]|nr:hypothetical protein [Actinomycetota bacterium]
MSFFGLGVLLGVLAVWRAIPPLVLGLPATAWLLLYLPVLALSNPPAWPIEALNLVVRRTFGPLPFLECGFLFLLTAWRATERKRHAALKLTETALLWEVAGT